MQMGRPLGIPGFSRVVRVGFVADVEKIQGIYELVKVLKDKGAIAIGANDFGILEMAKWFGYWGGDGNRSVILYFGDGSNISYFAEVLRTRVEWFEVISWIPREEPRSL